MLSHISVSYCSMLTKREEMDSSSSGKLMAEIAFWSGVTDKRVSKIFIGDKLFKLPYYIIFRAR